MMEKQPPRYAKKAWAAFVGLSVVLLVSSVYLVTSVASRRWKAFESSITLRVNECRSRETKRPVLGRQALPGKAWDHYIMATTTARALDSKNDLELSLNDSKTVDIQAVKQLLGKYVAPLAHLRDGVSREDIGCPLTLNGDTLSLASKIHDTDLDRIALAHVRLLILEGRSGEALSILKDLAQFGRDLGRNSTYMMEILGYRLQKGALVEMAAILDSAKCDDEVLFDLLGALSILDAGYDTPSFSAFNETTEVGILMLRAGAPPRRIIPRRGDAGYPCA